MWKNEEQTIASREHMESEDKIREMGKCLTISICYAAKVGSNATLIGTVLNIYMKDEADR